MGDKKTDYSFPVFFGDRYHVGDEVLRCQYLQYLDRSATTAVVTEVAVTRCNDQRCSYWTKPTNEPTGTDKIDEAENEPYGSSISVGQADAMGPLNIMAAIIPFEPTWSIAACEDEELRCNTTCDVNNCMCSQSFDVVFSSSSESMGTADIGRLSPGSKLSTESSIEIRTFDDDEEMEEGE